MPLLTSLSLVGLMTSRRSLAPYVLTGNIVRLSPSKMVLSYVEKPLIVPPSERERILHQFYQGITKSQLPAHECIFCPGLNKAIEEVVHQCETCTQFQAQNAAAALTPMPTPSHPWQMCALDIFTLEGADYLICGNVYSKMILI